MTKEPCFCGLPSSATCDWRPIHAAYGDPQHLPAGPFRVCSQHAHDIENNCLSIGDGETPITWDRPKAPRTVHVTADTPADFRALVTLVSFTGCATKSSDGFTIRDETKWSQCLAACNVREENNP